MSVRILVGTESGENSRVTRFEMAAIYDSVTDTALGPIFHENEDVDKDAHDVAAAFLGWLPQDARYYAQADLMDKQYEFLKNIRSIVVVDNTSPSVG